MESPPGKPRRAIGIDVGGTHTRVAVVDERGRVAALRRGPTPRDERGDALVRWLIENLRSVEAPIAAARGSDGGRGWEGVVGLALPGIIDRERGSITRSVNLPFLEGRTIVSELSEATSCEVTLYTDADAAAWGEYRAACEAGGIERDDRFVHLRIGTGVGCGMVAAGEIEEVEVRGTGHLDILVVDHSPQAIPCRCGKRGCLETLASGHALQERAIRLGYEGGIADLQRGWAAGDRGVVELIASAADALAVAVGELARTLGADVICIGGGVITLIPFLPAETAARWSASGTCDPKRWKELVRAAVLGDDAGVVGAALLAMGRGKSSRARLTATEKDLYNVEGRSPLGEGGV